MAFKPVIKVRNQKQQANSKRKAATREAKTSQNAKQNAERQARKKLRAHSSDLSNDEIAIKENQLAKEYSKGRVLTAVKKGAICVEIGVRSSDFSKQILNIVKPLNLALIDPWIRGEEPSNLPPTHSDDAVLQNVCQNFASEINNGQITIIRETSKTGLSRYSDGTIDFAYIDGDHTYEGVKADLENIFPKITVNGIVAFDGYFFQNEFSDIGVLQAIHEFIGTNPKEVRILLIEGSQIALSKLGAIEDANK
jgi:hypothetical protein